MVAVRDTRNGGEWATTTTITSIDPLYRPPGSFRRIGSLNCTWGAPLCCAVLCAVLWQMSLPSHIFKNKLRAYIDGALEYSALFKRKYSAGRPWLLPLQQLDVARLEQLEELLPLEMVLTRRA